MERKLASFYEAWRDDEDVIRELAHGSNQDVIDFFSVPNDETEDTTEEKDTDMLEDARVQELVRLAEEGTLDASHLTPAELTLFHSALKRGELDDYVEAWTPWWLQAVEVLDGKSAPIPHICCRGGTHPNSFRVGLFLVHILYGYCWTLRQYNGSISSSNRLEALNNVCSVVPGLLLEKYVPPATMKDAVSANLSHIRKIAKSHGQEKQFPLLCYNDVLTILKDKWKCRQAVQELRTLITKVSGAPTTNQHRQNLKRIAKRVDYYLSFAEHHCYGALPTPDAQERRAAAAETTQGFVIREALTEQPFSNQPASATESPTTTQPLSTTPLLIVPSATPTLASLLSVQLQQIVDLHWSNATEKL